MLEFGVEATDGGARAGMLRLANGDIETPCFMPVGTRAAVRTLTSTDLEELDAQIILGNTYHLMLRPGADTIAGFGGLHGFMAWDRPVLTDSGGYQVFSLEPKITDDGATFRSTYDGSTHHLTPELAVEIQSKLGSDIQMVLDVCPPLPSPHAVIADAVEQTARWAERARTAFLADTSVAARGLNQFGIVQGGTELSLRAESVERTLAIGFDGYAIGGLSVGEDRSAWLDPLEHTTDLLPDDLPRYFMGLGDPIGVVEAVHRGVDMFDCVLPTRLARHGTMLTTAGRLNLDAARYANDHRPVDPLFPASPANRWSRGYLRHLLQVKETAATRVLTMHNVAWLLDLMGRIRDSIRAGTFQQLRAEVLSIWS